MNIFKYLKSACIIILFAWISFFPQPVQDKYWLYGKIFVGAFLLLLILNKKYLRHLFSFRDWPLWLFFLCLSSGMVCATNKAIALKTYLYLITNFFFLFYIGKALFRFDEDRNMVSAVIFICCAVVALIGIIQLFFAASIFYKYFIFEIHYSPRELRLQSTQYNPIILGSFLLGAFPFNFYFLRNGPPYRKLLGIFCSLFCIIVIIFTFSRSAFLGLIAMLSFWLWKKERKKALVVLFCILLLFVIIFSFQKGAHFNRFGSNSFPLLIENDIYRVKLTVMSLKMFGDHPFFGVGFNHFRTKFSEYYNKAEELPPYEFRVPDNMYLTLLSETGIVGASGFFVFIFFLFGRGLKVFNKFKYENIGYMLLIVLAALAGLLTNMAAYELFYWDNPYMIFCLICGFIQGAMFSL